VIVASSEQGNGVLGVIDGSRPKGIEDEEGRTWRRELLQKFGYKL
jgi:adenosine/AMP kinase